MCKHVLAGWVINHQRSVGNYSRKALVMDAVNVVATATNAHRTERARFRSLDDAIDVFALRG
jgi:hypothetical protein